MENPAHPELSDRGDGSNPLPSSVERGVSVDVSSLEIPSTLVAGPSNTQTTKSVGSFGTSPLLQILKFSDASPSLEDNHLLQSSRPESDFF